MRFFESGASLPYCVLLSLPCIMAISGCTIADQFGSRASIYNREVAETTSNTVLTNILRSAYRKPLQFTSLQSVTGSASVNAGIQSSLPAFPGPGDTTRTGTLSPSISAQGGPTFQVANQNNLEFYNGIKAPISAQLMASYIADGYNAHVLYPLLFNDIEIDAGGDVVHISNSGNSPAEFAGFYSAVNQLLDAGLTVEQTSQEAQIGATMSAAEVKQPEFLGRYLQASAQATKPLPVPKPLPNSQGKLFGLIKSGSSYRFCFDGRIRQHNPYPGIDYTVGPTKIQGFSFPLAKANNEPIIGGLIKVTPSDMCGGKAAARDEGKLTQNMRIRPRSVEGVFRFLGNIARRELESPHSAADFAVPGGKAPFGLFRVARGGADRHGIQTEFEGDTYSIKADPTGYDGSSEVIQILVSLIALNSSSKDLPTQTLIAVGSGG